MPFEREFSDNIETIIPLHIIDSFSGMEIRKYICDAAEFIDGAIIDFSKVTYVNSSGLRELILIYKCLKNLNKFLFLVNLNSDINQLFIHTNLIRLFSIYPTVEEALDSRKKIFE